MDAGVVFGQMLVLLAMMALGYYAHHRGWIDDGMAKKLSVLVVNVFNPALILGSVAGGPGNIGGADIRANLILILVYFAALFLLGFPLVWILRPVRQERRVYRMMTLFSNLGFMGIPVVKSIFGQEAVLYVAFYILAYNLLLYTYGFALARKAAEEAEAESGGKGSAEKRFGAGLWNPGVAAALGAILIFALGIELPFPIRSFCEYAGDATIPLSMMLIGVSVAQADMGKQWRDWRTWSFILMRMVVFPAAMILAGRSLPVNEVVFGVFIVECCMPVGSIVTMIVKNSGAGEECCVRGTLVSTLASVVTIPLVCSLL